MDLQLKGKTALVSGSTQGIGYAIAKRLLQEQATVIINGRNINRVNQAVEKLKQEVSGAQVTGVAADFANTADIDRLLTEVPDVDILVNNFGIFEPKPFEEITDDDWSRFFDLNVLSGVRLSRHYFPKMLAKNDGRIIFISSESGVVVAEEMIHYSTTKSAQLTISRGLAQLTKGTNVTVNSVLPGPTKSEGVTEFVNQLATAKNVSPEQAESDFFKNDRPASLIQRFAHVDEIANLVAYVASPLSAATNGAALRADGGITRVII
jgi:NAD(P)-dependent dehydrogenase (short-subunit alcohol dehydrogenase family)